MAAATRDHYARTGNDISFLHDGGVNVGSPLRFPSESLSILRKADPVNSSCVRACVRLESCCHPLFRAFSSVRQSNNVNSNPR